MCEKVIGTGEETTGGPVWVEYGSAPDRRRDRRRNDLGLVRESRINLDREQTREEGEEKLKFPVCDAT